MPPVKASAFSPHHVRPERLCRGREKMVSVKTLVLEYVDTNGTGTSKTVTLFKVGQLFA